MDYASGTRLKIFVHVEVVPLDTDPDLATLVSVPGYKARPERILRFRLDAFDWNCPQRITPRFTHAEIAEAVQSLCNRLAAFETENAELRGKLATKEEAE
jgi:hypothetical protein